MNTICKIILMAGLSGLAIAQNTHETQALEAPAVPERPIVAVPAFLNSSGGHMTRIAPGKYRERNVRVGNESRHELYEENGKRINSNSDRDVYEKQLERDVEYTPGDFQLPENAGVIAADAATDAISKTGKFRLLSRSTPVLRMLENERAYAATGGENADNALQVLDSMGATYILYGSINSFRISQNKGTAYGVRRWQVVTTVNIDLKLVGVKDNEIVSSRNTAKKVVLNIPEGVTEMESSYDWESTLRSAVSAAVPEFMRDVKTGMDISSGKMVGEKVEVVIECDQPGASIRFNGRFVGSTRNTPVKLKLPAQPGTLSIEKAGYQPWREQLTPEEELSINATLEKQKEAPTPIVPELNIIK